MTERSAAAELLEEVRRFDNLVVRGSASTPYGHELRASWAKLEPKIAYMLEMGRDFAAAFAELPPT